MLSYDTKTPHENTIKITSDVQTFSLVPNKGDPWGFE